ncbi:MAG: TolC family protein [Pirellulales bacterium]
MPRIDALILLAAAGTLAAWAGPLHAQSKAHDRAATLTVKSRSRPVARRASASRASVLEAPPALGLVAPANNRPERTSSAVRLKVDDEILPDPTTPPARPEPVPPTDQHETAAGITLEELEAIALSSNPTLLQANAAVRSAEGIYVQSGLPPNPNIGWSSVQMGEPGNSLAGQQGPYFEQMLVLGGKLRLNRQVESQRVRQAVARRDGQVLAVLNDVRIGYYNVLIAQRKLQVTRQLVEIGEAGVQAAEALVEAEQVSRVDLLQAKVEANSARIQHRNAINHYNAAWRSLTAVMGAPHMPAVQVAGDIQAGTPPLDWDESLMQILASSPELAAARAGVSRAQFSIQRARREPFPDADVQYFPQRDFGTDANIHSVQAYLVVPLWNQNQGNIRAAEADLTAARADVNRLQLDLQNRLAAAFERYANARQQAELYSQQILPDAQESLNLVTQGYRQGEFNYLLLLTAQRTYFNTNLEYLAALQSLRENTVAIQGMLLTGNLERSFGPQ